MSPEGRPQSQGAASHLGAKSTVRRRPAARKQLAQKSLALFNQEWTLNGHVHENYNAITGTGDDVSSSDRFYHWGALLGLIDFLENPAKADSSAAPR